MRASLGNLSERERKHSVPEKLYTRVFRTMSTMSSCGSLSSLASPLLSDYQSWLKSFYASRINDFLEFQDTSHILTPQSEGFSESDDSLFEPCLLDCHTEEGFVLTAAHLILHMIRSKQAKSPDSVVTIGLSGGSTPKGIYRFLGAMQDLDIDFGRIVFFLVDERYVPSDDEMSNLRLLRNTLLKHWPIPESNLVFPDTSLPLEECVKKYEEDLERIFGPVLFTPDPLTTTHHTNTNSVNSNSVDTVDLVHNTQHNNSVNTVNIGDRVELGDRVESSNLHSDVLGDSVDKVDKGKSSEVVGDRGDLDYRPKYKLVPDLVTLGIGQDFHIAGLFPEYLSTLDSSYVTDSMHRVMASYNDTTVVRERITCSLPFLCCAKTKLFFLKGERKKRIWNTMLEYRHYDPIRFPATQIFTRPGCIAVLDSSTIRRVRLKVPVDPNDHLSFILFGSGGDLARRKLYPALFHLFYLGFLPAKFHILAISRSERDFEDFFTQVSNDIFYSINTNIFIRNPAVRCIKYDDETLLDRFSERLAEIERNSETTHRMVYLATPSESYKNILKLVTSRCKPKSGWFRVMLEKPFGRDLGSCEEIDRFLRRYVSPDEFFLVDHYLGKPVISCILSSKLSDKYGPLFCNKYIRSVHIVLKEEIGSFGRYYFESYGIIRDMIQNHGMQLLSLIAMRCRNKKSLSQDKFEILQFIRTATLEDLVIGQYTESDFGCAYRQEAGVPSDSLCPTYCTMVLWVDHEDWKGVPFVITAGKGLNEKLVEIRLAIKRRLPKGVFEEFEPTHLVYRIQPSPSVFWLRDLKEARVGEVKDGLGSDLESESNLNTEERILIDVEASAAKRSIEGAYELLFFYAFSNKREIFPTISQVNEAWRILTPVLERIDKEHILPYFYPRGSTGPKEADDLLSLL